MRQRGYAALGAMMVVFALGAVATIGLNARTRDLGFEARSLRRHQARWAAESGIARARLRRASGRPLGLQASLPGHLVCSRVSYSTTADGNDRIRATGRCIREGRKDVTITIDITLRGAGRGRIVRWREGPTPR